MNILFYRYNSICEPDLIAVLEELGHSVEEMTEEMTNKNISAAEQLAIISGALKKKTYDMVFSINFFPIVSEVCNIFKTFYVCWIVDAPVLELYSWSIRNECNRIFLFDYALYEEFSAENPQGIFYLPLGANYERLDRLIAGITQEDRKKYASEISFIGSLYTEKCPYNRLKEDGSYLKGYLDGLIEAQMKVYGYNFLEECISDTVLENFKIRLNVPLHPAVIL